MSIGTTLRRGNGHPVGARFQGVSSGETYETAVVTETVASLVLRFLCLWLVGQIPDRGLPELYECLERIRDFYTEDEDGVSFEPHVERMPVRMRTPFERPVFHVDEE